MRRWELVGDGVAEFWEVEVEGAEVTVRSGRLGAGGRSATTPFDSEAVASAHVEELIAGKEAEGYASVPAFSMPVGWRSHVHVRRGGGLRSDAVVAAGAVEGARAALAERSPEVEAVLANPASDQDMVAAARAHLAGEVTPLGAAVLAELLGSVPRSADAWVLEHGLPFAACAALETHCVHVHGNDRDAPLHLRRLPLENRFDLGTVRRVRSLLAAAADEEHEAAMAAVAKRRTDLRSMLASTYLFPGRQDWVDEAFDEIQRTSIVPYLRGLTYGLLSYACSTAAQLERALAVNGMEWYLYHRAALFTVVDGIGPAVAPALASILDRDLDGDFQGLVLETLVEFPTAEAFDSLLVRLKVKRVLPTVLAMARRYPVVALERFAAAGGAQVRPLLERHLRGHLDLADRVDLPEDVRAFVEEVRAERAGIEDAPSDALPAILVDPPWVVKEKPKPAKPVVVKGLTAPDHRAVEWEPGERAAWDVKFSNTYRTDDWAPLIDLFRAGNLDYERQVGLFLSGPVDELRSLVPDWNRGMSSTPTFFAKCVVARFEVDAIPNALELAVELKGDQDGLVLPLVSLETARLVAQWLVKLKSTRELCVTWLRRHPLHAARFLVPDAVGPAGAARRAAETALRVVPDQAGEAAREYGPEAEAAIAAMLAVDVVVPVKAPTLGKWIDLAALPPVLLRGTRQALPAEAVGHLLTLLALSTPDDGHADVEAVRAACDEASLARFSWELFEVWRANGMPSKDGWVFTALGLLGDDEAVRGLVPLIRAWPGEGQHARAVTGLDVLAAIGTDAALAGLNGIAQRVKFAGIRTRAQERIRDVAAGMGLTAEELGDRLVPDFGLDDASTLVVDYGSRRFTVGFDEQLRPFVLDGSGKRLRDLPKPGAKDDGGVASAEHMRFGRLKKDVRTVAGDQVARLERSMVLVRRWPAAQFRVLLAGHPLVRHLVRRLVWVTEDGCSFRVAEDGTFADVRDEVFVLADDAVVGVAHPLHLGDAVAAWGEVFADYEILQPFPQLGRPVYRLTEAELSSGVLDRVKGVEVEVGRLLGLTKGAWERGAPMDAGIEHEMTRPLPGGGTIEMPLNPGIVIGAPDEFGAQVLGEVHLRGKSAFAEVDPVTASELLAELTSLKG